MDGPKNKRRIFWNFTKFKWLWRINFKKNDNKKEYILPDGNIVELGNEIYEIPESIFNPNILEIQTNNLPHTIINSIKECDISARKELFNNIILGGGNTFIKGFEIRL